MSVDRTARSRSLLAVRAVLAVGLATTGPHAGTARAVESPVVHQLGKGTLETPSDVVAALQHRLSRNDDLRPWVLSPEVRGAVHASPDVLAKSLDVLGNMTGSLSVGASAAPAGASLVYVVDVSGSTLNDGGCGGDANRDGVADTLLDCEVVAVQALNRYAQATGRVAEVGIVAFAATAATADLEPLAGHQPLVGPGADQDGSGTPDIDEVLSSVFTRPFGGDVGFAAFSPAHVANTATHFAAGIQAACELLASASTANRMVVFLTDGKNNIGSDVADSLPCHRPVTFHVFAIGSHVRCASASSRGGLQAIADLTAGTCTDVHDLTPLPTLLEYAVPGFLRSLAHERPRPRSRG